MNDSENREPESILDKRKIVTDRLFAMTEHWMNWRSRFLGAGEAPLDTARCEGKKGYHHPPKRVAAYLGRRLARDAIVLVADILRLERCAVLLPSEDKQGFWHLAGHIGYPEYVVRESYYQRGIGLTGLVLAGETVRSDDVLNDSRRSHRFGDMWFDSKGTPVAPADESPRAFLGVPIWLYPVDYRVQPSGAFVCARPVRTPSDHFGEEDEKNLKMASYLLSSRLDMIRAWRDGCERHYRQLELGRLWTRPISERQKYEDALRLLQEEIPFKRMLLSFVDGNARRIVGKAAIGFRPDLLSDTDRIIYDHEPEDPIEEDILALVCRLQIKDPFVVHKGHSRWKNVHQVTALRHHVRNPLMLIPMSSSAGEIMGVVLAELPDGRTVVTREERQRFSLYANQLGSFVTLHRHDEAATKRRRIWQGLREALFDPRFLDEEWDLDIILRRLLQQVQTELRIHQVLVYSYDEHNQILQGRVALGANEVVLRSVIYSVSPLSKTHSTQLSFATHVFTTHRTAFVPNVGKSDLFDQEDRKQVGISSSLGAIGVPLTHGRRTFGVMLLFSSFRGAPAEELSELLVDVAGAVSFAILLGRLQDTIRHAKRDAVAHQSIAHGIGRIANLRWRSDSPEGQENVGNAPPLATSAAAVSYAGTEAQDHIASFNGENLDLILRDLAVVFDANLAKLFFPKSPIVWSEGERAPAHMLEEAFTEAMVVSWPDTSDVSQAAVDPGFEVRRREGTLRVYWALKRSLTGSILATLEPQTTPNVEADPLWSGEVKEMSGLRTWMGVPLVLTHQKKQYCFGVLTFTRARKAIRDAIAFDQHHIRAAENIATLLSLAFCRRYEVEEMWQQVHACLEWFHHDLPQLFSAGRADAQLIERAAKKLPKLEQADEAIKDIRSRASLLDVRINAVAACFRAYRSILEADDPVWESRDVNWELLIGSIELLICDESSLGDTKLVLPAARTLPAIASDDDKLLYVIYALLHNAVLAVTPVRESRKGIVDLRIDKIESALSIEVKDNGMGVRSGLSIDILCGEGFTTRAGRGLGLSIVSTLLKGVGGSVSFRGNPDNKGTTFCVKIPVCMS